MLYIFNPTEALIALLKPDFTRSTGPTETSWAFLSAAFPAELDREPTEGCPYWDAVHREVLNGENTFTFTVPADQVDAAYVRESNLVAFKDLDSYWQIFEIKRLVDVHGDGLTRTAYCEHIFYELLDDIVIDKRPSAGATAALSGMLEGTRWQVGIVDDLGASSTSAYYESVLSGVQKVANAWQGELNWRCVISGGVITRYVDLRAMVGTDTGKQFAYSKDILNIEREEDISGIATALYGRGKGIELDSGSYGRRLTFADVIAADKPAGQEWIGDDDALSRWGRNGRHRFDVFIDEEETDPAVLLQKTRDELDRRKVPRVTYRLDVVSLEELTGYEHEAVRLGDLVRVIDREFTPELVVSARVIEIERDILDPANTKVVLGSFAPTIVEATINTARRVNDMANRPFNTKWLDGKISVLQNEIENTTSFVFQNEDDGILILDAADYATATKAMKLGGGIFAIANQKDGNGGWNWRTFGDGSGFTADLITAGMIDAGLVQIGPQTTFAPGYDPVDNHLYFEYSVDGMNWHTIFNSASDLYMRQKVGDNGTWSEPARIAAVDGVDGVDGQDGTSIVWKGEFTSHPISPQNGWAYRNTADGKSYVYQDGTWYQMTIDGVDGQDGKTPVKGADYFDGVDGQDGADGTSSYLWVRYSQNSNGNPMTTDPTGAVYIGIATTTTPSAPTSYTAYSWSLIKGQDGVPGEKGADGRTSYLHIKYADENYGDVSTGKESGMSASSMYSSSYSPDNLVDGSIVFGPGTHFGTASGAVFPQWHQIDLGDVFNIDKVRWIDNSITGCYPKDYTIAISETGAFAGEQTVVVTKTGNAVHKAWVEHTFNPTKGRYVRMTVSASAAGSYYELSEWQVYGTYLDFTANEGETPGAYIGTYVDFNPVDSMNFNDYTWNKVKGTSIVWKGDLASPPSNPEENWVYRDTDNGYVYIYNGTAWELMVTDGADGIDGAPGADGMSVYITYHNNPTDSPPATPTGDGTSGGWYTAPSAQANWMSQKVATNAYSGTWGAPILISGGRKFTSQPVPPYDVGDLWIGGSDGQNTLICTTARSSGSFVASDWERMTEPVANVGVDADCLGLWHFDGSLNSHKGVAAIGDANFDTGCFGQAVKVEEGTTNIHPNGSVTKDADANNIPDAFDFYYKPDGESITWLKTGGINGTGAIRVDGINVGRGAVQTPNKLIPATAGVTYTASAYYKIPQYNSGVCVFYIEFLDSTGTRTSISSTSVSGQTLNWTRVSLTALAPANTAYVRIWSPYITDATPSMIIDMCCFQIEAKDHASPFVDGTRLGVLKAPTTGLSASQGTISFRAKNLSASANGSVLVDLPKSDNTQGIKAGIASDGRLYIKGTTATTAYGPNKSTLTLWDSISLAWKSDRLSLVVNDEEACYIENPGLPPALGNYLFIGTDRNSANAINTYIDELRIDKVYREVNIRTGWHKTGVPFYTSEDMKQWPGYLRAETDGLKVYDSSNALRVLLGSWLRGAVRKYGLKIIGGEIYSSIVRSGAEDASKYIQFNPPNFLEIWSKGKLQMLIEATDSGRIYFYKDASAPDDMDNYRGLIEGGRDDADIYLSTASMGTNKVKVAGNLDVSGNMSCSGSKPAQQVTENYGLRYMYATEAPELVYYDRGAINLVKGEATVYLDPIYLECIEPDTDLTPWQIWVQAYGENDVYVSETGTNYFKVKERNGGTSNNRVVWKHEAIRNGYAGIRLMEVTD